jgi:hypothetical protein
MIAFGGPFGWPLRLLALFLTGSALLLALLHLDDLYAAHQGPGIWMALARALNAGTLYPPLQEDGYYGGTRYTPLFFTLTAGLAWTTPDYLVAAKLAALLSVAVLVSAIAAAIRQMTGRWNEVPLVALVLAFPQGLNAALMPHSDALAAGLTIWGLVALGPKPTLPRIVGSALLFVLAVLTKFSTLAGPAAAIIPSLALRANFNRRRSVELALACVLLGLGSLGLIDWLSQGRFLENLRALGGGGSGLDSALQAPIRMGQSLRLSLGFALLLPLLGAALLVRARQLSWGLWDWYLLTSLIFTLLVYTSLGTADNHILELEAAGVLFLAQSLSTPASPIGLERLLQPLLALAALAALLLGFLPHIGTWRVGESAGAVSKSELDAIIPRNARLLAEAPAIPVLRGQRPVIQDAFCFQVLARSGKIDDAALAQRIRRHEFDFLIMLGRTDREGETFCPDTHLGPRVTQAILDSYHFERMLGLYALFVPGASKLPKP